MSNQESVHTTGVSEEKYDGRSDEQAARVLQGCEVVEACLRKMKGKVYLRSDGSCVSNGCLLWVAVRAGERDQQAVSRGLDVMRSRVEDRRLIRRTVLMGSEPPDASERMPLVEAVATWGGVLSNERFVAAFPNCRAGEF